MSGLGMAKNFGMRWRNLPRDATYKFTLHDSKGNSYSKNYSLNEIMKINHEEAQKHQDAFSDEDKEKK